MPKFHGMIAQRLHLPDCRHHSRDEGVVDRSTKHSKGRRILSANLQSLVDATQDSTQRPRPGDSKGRIVPCLLEHHVPERFGLVPSQRRCLPYAWITLPPPPDAAPTPPGSPTHAL